MKIEFNDLGMVQKLIVPQGTDFEFNQEFWMYSGTKAGAYIFQPTSPGRKMYDITLDSMKILNGPVVQVAEMVWKRSRKRFSKTNYYQRIILFGENRFQWQVGLYSALGEEILLRFTSKDIRGDQYLITSNSGDLRKRKFFEPNKNSERGANMYPAPGGFAVKLKENYFKLFSKFSLGVHMASKESFEILMHRSLAQDDNLGLNEGVDDRTFVNYKFEIEIGDLTAHHFRKDSLEVRHEYISYFVSDNVSLNLVSEISESQLIYNIWDRNLYYNFGFDNSFVFLSSATKKKDGLVFRLMNLLDGFQGLTLQDFNFGKRKLLDGFSNPIRPHR